MLSVEEIEETVKMAIEEFNKENKKVKAYIASTYQLDYEYCLTYNLPFKEDVEVFEVVIKPKPDYIVHHVRVIMCLPLESQNKMYIAYGQNLLPKKIIKFSNKEEAKVKLRNVLNEIYKCNRDTLEIPKDLLDLLEKIKEIARDFYFYVDFRLAKTPLAVVNINIFDTTVVIKIDNKNGCRWSIEWAEISFKIDLENLDVIKEAIKRYLEFNNIKCEDFECSLFIDLTNINDSEKLNVVRKIIEGATIPHLI